METPCSTQQAFNTIKLCIRVLRDESIFDWRVSSRDYWENIVRELLLALLCYRKFCVTCTNYDRCEELTDYLI